MTCQDSFHEVAFNISFWTRNISGARILFWRGVSLLITKNMRKVTYNTHTKYHLSRMYRLNTSTLLISWVILYVRILICILIKKISPTLTKNDVDRVMMTYNILTKIELNRMYSLELLCSFIYTWNQVYTTHNRTFKLFGSQSQRLPVIFSTTQKRTIRIKHSKFQALWILTFWNRDFSGYFLLRPIQIWQA